MILVNRSFIIRVVRYIGIVVGLFFVGIVFFQFYQRNNLSISTTILGLTLLRGLFSSSLIKAILLVITVLFLLIVGWLTFSGGYWVYCHL